MARQGWKNMFAGPNGKDLMIVKLPMGTSDAKALAIAEREHDALADQSTIVVPMVGEPDQEPGLFGGPSVVRWIKANRQMIKEKPGWKAISFD